MVRSACAADPTSAGANLQIDSASVALVLSWRAKAPAKPTVQYINQTTIEVSGVAALKDQETEYCLLTDSQGQQTGLSEIVLVPRKTALVLSNLIQQSHITSHIKCRRAMCAETVDFVAYDWSTVSPVTPVTDADAHNKHSIPECEEIKTEIKMEYPNDKSFKKVPNLKVDGQDSAIATFVEHHPGENGLGHYQVVVHFKGKKFALGNMAWFYMYSKPTYIGVRQPLTVVTVRFTVDVLNGEFSGVHTLAAFAADGELTGLRHCGSCWRTCTRTATVDNLS